MARGRRPEGPCRREGAGGTHRTRSPGSCWHIPGGSRRRPARVRVLRGERNGAGTDPGPAVPGPSPCLPSGLTLTWEHRADKREVGGTGQGTAGREEEVGWGGQRGTAGHRLAGGPAASPSRPPLRVPPRLLVSPATQGPDPVLLPVGEGAMRRPWMETPAPVGPWEPSPEPGAERMPGRPGRGSGMRAGCRAAASGQGALGRT